MAGHNGTTRPHLTIQADVMDVEGNMRAADIGITWEGNETFLHGVKVVGSQFSRLGVKGRSCLHPIRRGTEKTEGTRLRRLNRPHRRHLMWMAMFADPLRKCAKDTDRPHPSNDSTKIPQLAGVVSSFPGSGGRPLLEQGPESVTTSVLPRRDRHECGPRTRRQRSLQLRCAGQTIK